MKACRISVLLAICSALHVCYWLCSALPQGILVFSPHIIVTPCDLSLGPRATKLSVPRMRISLDQAIGLDIISQAQSRNFALE